MSNSCCASKAPVAEESLSEKIALYRPLIVIAMISVFTALALSVTGRVPMMNGLMGMFLCFLSALKFFNLSGFAAGFAQYDVVASRYRPYGTAYPFIELVLGLLYLSGLWPLLSNIAMIGIMSVGTMGVIKTIRSGQSVQCACVGTGFNIPVGRVTLTENVVMAAMAAASIVHLYF